MSGRTDSCDKRELLRVAGLSSISESIRSRDGINSSINFFKAMAVSTDSRSAAFAIRSCSRVVVAVSDPPWPITSSECNCARRTPFWVYRLAWALHVSRIRLAIFSFCIMKNGRSSNHVAIDSYSKKCELGFYWKISHIYMVFDGCIFERLTCWGRRHRLRRRFFALYYGLRQQCWVMTASGWFPLIVWAAWFAV